MIQSILKLYEDASCSKTDFAKSQAFWTGDYKNRFDKPGAMVGQISPLKSLE